MTVQSIVRAHVRLTALGAILLLGLAGCRDDSSPTDPMSTGPLLTQVASAPVVNSLADPGTGGCDDTECTLREAIAFAQSGATITFSVTGTIELGSKLSISNKGTLTIEGPGADDLTIEGNGTERVFEIVSPTTTLSNMTIAGGNRVGENDGGGGIYQQGGTLSIVRATITGNTTGGSGGGIYSNTGNLSITASTISGNSAWGGAGVFQYGGTLMLTESTVENNTATSGGGGVLVYSATQAHLTDCLFTANTSENSGAGIAVQSTPLRVERCTFTGNIVSGLFSAGGGLDFMGVEVDKLATVVNSTFSGNTAWRGAAIHNYSGTMKISHSTFTGNTSTGESGMGLGVGAVLAYDPTQVKNSIIWGNPGGDVSIEGLENNPYTSLGYNLVGADGENVTLTSVFYQTGDQTGVTDAKLGTLQLNAPGTTPTHALLDGSPAIDAGVCADADEATVSADQRGVSRPQGDACDIGAYEAGGTVPSTLVVNTLADHDDGSCDDLGTDTDCTLREAIAYAASGATITFDPALTSGGPAKIQLASAGPTISQALTITGPGASSLAVSGWGAYTVFFVTGGPASISGLTITEGKNTQGGGGGIDVPAAGDLTLTDCVISGNLAQDNGGGIYNAGTVTLVNSEVSGNTAQYYGGGGIHNHTGGVLNVINSSVIGNQASYGGGIHVYDGQATVTASTISGNGAEFTGGGINLGQGTLTITNSTVSGNIASKVAGGGIYNAHGTARIVLSTITANRAGTANSAGGGIHAVNDPGYQTIVKGSIIWGNTLADGSTANDVAALNKPPTPLLQTLGYNLIGVAGANVDFTEDFTGTGDQTGVANAGLGALADNGGPTLTHALLTNSPAIDKGTCTDHEDNTVAEDQRGVSRPQGAACDIGAYEGGTVSTADELDVTVDASTSITRTYVWEISKGPDATYRGLAGKSWEHTYEIEVKQNKDEEAPSYTDAWSVSGTITVANNTLLAATIESVSDVVSTGVAATVDCGEGVAFPYTLAAGASLLCSYGGDLPDGTTRTNTATVTTSGAVSGDEATASVDFTNAALVNGNPTVHVTDDYATPDDATDDLESDALGDGEGFEYPYTFACPTDLSLYTQGVYTKTIVNTATIDEYSTLSDDATVTLTCYVPAQAKVFKTTTEGTEDIGQAPFSFALYKPDSPPGYGSPVETVTLNTAGEFFFTTELKDEGPWTVVEVLPAGWVSTTDPTCTFVVDYPPLYEEGNVSSAGKTYTCNFDNVEKSRVDLVKLTDGQPTTTQTWSFKIFEGPDGFGGTEVASDNTPPALLDFGLTDVNKLATYTLCELEVPAGYSTFWQIDTNGDGVGDVTVVPYNPNEDDDPPEDLGNRCVDIGANTGIAFWPGATLHFVVNNGQPGGAPRSNGYWKNWNRCTGGGQQYTADANGGWPEGFWLLEDVLTPGIGGGVTWDDILDDNFTFPIASCAVAVDILDQRKVGKLDEVADGKKQASDPLFSLAAHLLAAQFNFGAGACVTNEVQAWVLEAETLLDTYDFDGDGHDNLGKKDDNAARANELAALLDSYNTGMICGNGGE